jgi:hypothetical protein
MMSSLLDGLLMHLFFQSIMLHLAPAPGYMAAKCPAAGEKSCFGLSITLIAATGWSWWLSPNYLYCRLKQKRTRKFVRKED